MSNKRALAIAQQMAMKRAKGKVLSLAVQSVGTDTIGETVLKETANKTFKAAFGLGMLFFEFVETYSKAVREANLENVRRNLEVCPHIGGCQSAIDAMRLVSSEGVTAWQAHDRYWYFHPQPDYRVRHAVQIYRYLPDRDTWAVELPGKPRVAVQDCLACVEAHAGGTK
jgi:hypothetical protein